MVKVPFPYIDRPVRQRRPALVIGAGERLQHHGLLWVMMITSAENRRWAGDIEVEAGQTTGLPVASLIRTAKIATVEATDVEMMGRLPTALARDVTLAVRRNLKF